MTAARAIRPPPTSWVRSGPVEVRAVELLAVVEAPGEAVPLVITTHECSEATMRAALSEIGGLDIVIGRPNFIRIEAL